MWLNNLWNRITGNGPETFNLRRWTTAKTDRLNEAHWAGVRDESVNKAIARTLADYRAKCTAEATDNPFVAGMIHTQTTDIVGPDGPVFQSQSSSKRFNRAMEAVWNTWFEMPDLNGQVSGVDMMRTWIPQMWTSGEFVEQLTNDRRILSGEGIPDDEPGSRVVSLRLLSINTRRIASPLRIDPTTVNVDGVEVDNNGKPLRLWIKDFMQDESAYFRSTMSSPYDASGFLHCFQRIEANQVRGFPWLAPGLQTAADIRDLDVQMLDGLRQAADWMVFFECKDPNNPPLKMSGELTTKRRMMRALPANYEAKGLQGTQPTTNFTTLRNMRLAELGRVVSMPLMMIKLDSADHSFSAANFDAQIYARGNAATQSWLERVALRRLVRMVRREAAFSVPALRSVPDDWQITFTWPRPPHVDPVKSASALQILLQLGLISEIEACGQLGLDYEQIAANIARVKDIRGENGIGESLAQQLVAAQQGAQSQTATEKRLESMIIELREQIVDILDRSKNSNAV